MHGLKRLKTPPATSLLKWNPVLNLSFKRSYQSLRPSQDDGKTNTKSTKAKLPTRSMTQGHNKQRPSIIKNTNEQQQTSPTPPTIINNKGSNAKIEHDAANNTRSTPQKQTNNAHFLALNIKKSIETNESERKPRSSRGVSLSVKSRVVNLSSIVELSNETPPNLSTDQRSSSTTRGRSTT
ncbi:hypothetical protein GLYMA_13G190700v4 [Glycine max]|nr:hypothetical protein GLYMA_13G190700v4 [Glycine max]KAH1102274.1 hypothetical protein GYH30_036694 [Glycine max]